MVQGTGSSVGKSLLATALCQIFRQDGYNVAPFKAQNMSLNSYVTLDGAEIGRAQVVQAQAAEVIPTAEMNPILLKPEVDYRSQLIIMGRPAGVIESRSFNQRREGLWDVVVGALDKLRSEYDVVVIEGAGSPAEINLRRGDIVNMEVALHADAPVLLVADIDRGGVFASVYGTILLLAEVERRLVRGVVINKFRGDVELLKPGLRSLEELTKVPVVAVLPYFTDIYIPEEDSPAAQNVSGGPTGSVGIDVAIIALPHIANFDDFDPFKHDEGVGLRYVRSLGELGSPDLAILPGTKTTVADMKYLRESGLCEGILGAVERGTALIGICGGYQMLGMRILDPDGVESDEDSVAGMGLLPVITRFSSEKQTHQASGRVSGDRGLLAEARGLAFEGYEIHMGTTTEDAAHRQTRGVAPLNVTRRSGEATDSPDGSMNGDGWVMGIYVHGLFHNSELRRGILSRIASKTGAKLPPSTGTFSQHREFDKLADLVRCEMDMDALYGMAGIGR